MCKRTKSRGAPCPSARCWGWGCWRRPAWRPGPAAPPSAAPSCAGLRRRPCSPPRGRSGRCWRTATTTSLLRRPRGDGRQGRRQSRVSASCFCRRKKFKWSQLSLVKWINFNESFKAGGQNCPILTKSRCCFMRPSSALIRTTNARLPAADWWGQSRELFQES